MKSKPRIALVVSHPIQHFCPQYVSFAEHPGIIFKVFFASALGYKPYLDSNFKQVISWNNLQLDKFDHVFLNGEHVLQPDKHLDVPHLEEALDEFKPDMLIIYGYFQQFQRRAYRWAKRKNIIIAYISDTEMRQKNAWWRVAMKYPFLYYFFSGINYALTVGDANEEYYRKVGLKKDQFIRMHFSIDIHYYSQAFYKRQELRNDFRKSHKIGENEFVASVVGKLVPWKNQADIINAMKILEKQGVYMHLFIVGSGEMMQQWQALATELKFSKVHFPGFVNADQLPAYYATSDCYIHPASIEPHSLAISEAIYMGCPVIISDRCGSYGPNDDVQDGKNGCVYPFGNTVVLAEKIRWMIEHPTELKSYSEFSHSIAVEFQHISHVGVVDKLVGKIHTSNSLA